MKVLFLYRAKSASGSNRVVVTQGKSLEKAGVEVEYFPLYGEGPAAYLRSVRRIRDVLKSGGARLVHAHYGISGIAGLLAARRRPLVVSFMGSDLLGSHTTDGRIRLWSRVMGLIHLIMARYFYSLSVVKSVEMRDKLLKKTRHVLIPNGVDMNIFAPCERSDARQKLNIGEGETVVLFPADRDNQEKNFALASAATERLRHKGFRLFVVNNASHEEMNLWFNAADLLLVTSFHEGSPNIVKEAMACGCPVVSTAVGDIPWLFGDLAGYYLSGFDDADLAVKAEAAARFRKEHLLTAGRERIIYLGLDAGSVSDILIKHYNRLIGEKKQNTD